MQSTDIRQIKVAIRDQAFIGNTRVSCPMGRVVAIRRRKGQLLVMVFGWGHWYTVESVTIDVKFIGHAIPRWFPRLTTSSPELARER